MDVAVHAGVAGDLDRAAHARPAAAAAAARYPGGRLDPWCRLFRTGSRHRRARGDHRGPRRRCALDRAAAGRHRRRPWAVGGALFTAACLALTGYAENPWTVGAGWVGVSIGVAVSSAAFTALIADQLPTTQRGAASAAVGSSQAVGIVVGVGLVVLLGLGSTRGISCSRASSRWSARPPLCCCRIPRPRRRCDRSRSDDAVWPRCEIGTSPGCSPGAS